MTKRRVARNEKASPNGSTHRGRFGHHADFKNLPQNQVKIESITHSPQMIWICRARIALFAPKWTQVAF